jgi:hypothetical protein
MSVRAFRLVKFSKSLMALASTVVIGFGPRRDPMTWFMLVPRLFVCLETVSHLLRRPRKWGILFPLECRNSRSPVTDRFKQASKYNVHKQNPKCRAASNQDLICTFKFYTSHYASLLRRDILSTGCKTDEWWITGRSFQREINCPSHNPSHCSTRHWTERCHVNVCTPTPDRHGCNYHMKERICSTVPRNSPDNTCDIRAVSIEEVRGELGLTFTESRVDTCSYFFTWKAVIHKIRDFLWSMFPTKISLSDLRHRITEFSSSSFCIFHHLNCFLPLPQFPFLSLQDRSSTDHTRGDWEVFGFIKKTTSHGIEKMYLLYIFPLELHTRLWLCRSNFFNPSKKKKIFSLCCK